MAKGTPPQRGHNNSTPKSPVFSGNGNRPAPKNIKGGQAPRGK